MAIRPASIKVRALQWLSQREHSRAELRSKLLHLLARPKPMASDALSGPAELGENAPVGGSPNLDPSTEVDQLLDWLEARGYVSDSRFVESRVRVRQSRFGTMRIQQELRQHGLSLDADARQALRLTEEQRAREVWCKKYGASAADATGRVRQMRFLAGRGFSADVVRRVVLAGARPGDDMATDPDGVDGVDWV